MKPDCNSTADMLYLYNISVLPICDNYELSSWGTTKACYYCNHDRKCHGGKVGTFIINEKLDDCIAEHDKTFAKFSGSKFVDQTLEEMAELTQALLKARRKNTYKETFVKSNSEDVLGEIADVLICLECLLRAKGISREQMGEYIEKKVNKWYANRVEKTNG